MSFSGIFPEGVSIPSPSRCISCGQDRRPIATTGVTIQGWGMVHICIGTGANPGCLMQLAHEAGMVSPGDAEDMRRKISELEAKVRVLQGALLRKPEDAGTNVVDADEVVNLISERLGVGGRT